MLTTVPTKTIGTSYLAWAAATATANQRIGAAIDVTTAHQILFHVQVGRASGSAFTVGPRIRVDIKVGGDYHPIETKTIALGASIANTTLNGAISAGATTAVLTAVTNVASGDILYLGHTSDVTKYELARVLSISGSTSTFEEAIQFAHDTGAQVTDQAETFTMGPYDIGAIDTIRLVVDNGNSGQSIFSEVTYSLLDEYTTT